MKIVHSVPAFLLALCAGLPVHGQTAPLRESTGQRLADLDKLELTAFPSSNWALLGNWANGAALDSAATDGNVVLIVTWANWNPSSTRVLAVAQKLAAENESKGLVVVGVHHNDGWEGAAEGAAKAGVTFRYAQDTSNGFRAALKVDSDPDFYLIDRAGQLRYADIPTQSVTSAVNGLLAETRESASGEVERRRAAQAKRDSDARMTGQIRQGIDLASLPEMDIPKVPADVYAKAAWPERWKDFESQELRINQFNFGGQTDIKVLELPKGANGVRWFDAQPNLNGRAAVVYFWSPNVYRSFSATQPMMDQLQREKGRDIAVVGVVMPGLPDLNSPTQPTAEDNEKARGKFLSSVEAARVKREYDHANVVDPDRSVIQVLLGVNNAAGEDIPYPLAAIFSSDMTLRWIGTATDSRFNTALEQVLRVDPAVRLRRAAEAEYIRTHGG